MNFLGARWSVLRLERDTGVLMHVPLADATNDGVDFSLDVPARVEMPLGVANQPGVMIEPASHPRLVHIGRGDQDLWADPHAPAAIFRDRDHGRFEFLLLEEAALAALRALFRHRWVRGDDTNGPEISILPRDGFVLDLGIGLADLRRHTPRHMADGIRCALETDAGEFILTPAGPLRDEWQLQARPFTFAPPRTKDEVLWRAGGDAWLELEGAEEFGTLPITVCDADRDWLFRNPYGGFDQTIGRHRCTPRVARESGKYVLLERHIEGMAFDEHGICNEDGYLESFGYRGVKPIHSPPRGVRADHGRLFVDREFLAEAPFVEGDTVICVLGNLSNYTHWLVDGLLALHVLLDFVPEGSRILLPGTLRGLRHAKRRVIDHADSLRIFGFDTLPTIEIAEPYCRLERAYWLHDAIILNMPATYMRAFRARVMARRPPPAGRDNKIYIARRGDRRVANAHMLVPFLERQGFATHYMEDYSIDQQIDLFSQAEWVIGPHGAEMGNLLFCQEGAKVLELAPDHDYKPYFSYMCNKLRLTHGVLPCPTTDGKFIGDLIVNMQKFAALFRMLKHRL